MKVTSRSWRYRIVVLFFVGTILGSCGGPSGNSAPQSTLISNDTPLRSSWDQNVAEYLRADLWTSDLSYDAAHILMIPMHWAFHPQNTGEYQALFDTYFERYTLEGDISEEPNRLKKLQYLYLHSQYLKLANYNISDSGFRAQIYKELIETIEHLWVSEEVATYGGRLFEGGMRERLRFKIDQESVNPEYAKAIFDEEFFFLAIAADLMVIDTQFTSGFLFDIQLMMHELFLLEGVEVGSGWLFQPGIWSNHPDYSYAGHAELDADLTPSIIEDIATDSSHFHRMPLWLLSFRDSYDVDRHEWAFFDNLLGRVIWQFENIFFVPPDADFPAPRLTNYTDGRNGIYRYGYDTVGNNQGYGPHQLSAVVLPLGWYAFLDSDLLYDSYESLQFPLSDTIVSTYVGPNTSRFRHPLVTWPDYFEGSFVKLHVDLAKQLHTWNSEKFN